MAPISIDSTLDAADLVNPIHINEPSDTNKLKKGDIIESWDFTFRWDENCLNADELEQMRLIPDPLVDDYLSTLPPELISPSDDQLAILLSLRDKSPEAQALLDHLGAVPPEGVRCDAEQMEEAMECFYRFAGGLLLGTFYISLVGGFSSPRITSVLHQTSYLVAPTIAKDLPIAVSSSLDAEGGYNPTDAQLEAIAYAPITDAVKTRTSVRLLETLQFVLDIMGSPMPSVQNIIPDEKGGGVVAEESIRVGPGCMKPFVGEGWRSTVRVRLLHGVVRRRVMGTMNGKRENGKKPAYDFDKDGYPLNAEDMSLTLASFCVAPLWACNRINSPIPPHLQAAYIAHWRHVGYYLGIPADILARHFDVTRSLAPPDKFFASCITHLFAHPADLADTTKLPPPALPLLHTVPNMPPFITPLKSHFRAARFFLGDSLATALNIPRVSQLDVVRLRFYFLAVVYPEWFGRYYPRRSWDRTRQALTQDLLGRMVRFKLEGRRSMFRPHNVLPGEGGIKQEGQLPKDVIEMEKKGIVTSKRKGVWAYVRYQGLMLEMLAVSGGVVGFTLWAGWRIAKSAWNGLT